MTADKNKHIQVKPGVVSIYQRERSAVWQCMFKAKDGRWRRRTTGEVDQAKAFDAALRIYYEAEVKIDNNLPINVKRFDSVADAVVQQLQEALDKGQGKASYPSYITAINVHLKPFFGKHNIDSINADLLSKFDVWRRKRAGRQLASSTITNHNTALNRIFDFAELHGWVTRATRPALVNRGVRARARPAFTREEYAKLIRKLPHWVRQARTERSSMMRELLNDYVLVLANTGIRHGTEAMNLKWRNIDWHVKDGQRYLRLHVNGKTGERTAIARHNTEDFLRRIQLRFDDLKHMSFDELIAARVDQHVFRLADGTQTANLNQTFDTLMDDTGLAVGAGGEQRRTLYSFRHMYATFQILDKVGIHELARQMGTSVAMLEEHYSKLTPELMADTFAGPRMGPRRKRSGSANEVAGKSDKTQQT